MASVQQLQQQLSEKDAEIAKIKAKAKQFVVEKIKGVQAALIEQEGRQQRFANLLALAIQPGQPPSPASDVQEAGLGTAELKLLYGLREAMAVAAADVSHAKRAAQAEAGRAEAGRMLESVKSRSACLATPLPLLCFQSPQSNALSVMRSALFFTLCCVLCVWWRWVRVGREADRAIVVLRSAKEKLVAQAAEITSLREQLAAAQSAAATHQEQHVAAAAAATAATSDELQRAEAAASQVTTLQSELHAASGSVAELQGLHAAELAAKTAAFAELNSSRDAVAAAAATAATEQQALQQQATELAGQIKSLAQANETLQQQLAGNAGRAAGGEAELEEKTAECAGLRAKVRSLQHELRRSKPAAADAATASLRQSVPVAAEPVLEPVPAPVPAGGAGAIAASPGAGAAQQSAGDSPIDAELPRESASGSLGAPPRHRTPNEQLETLRNALADSERKNELQQQQAYVLKAEIRSLDRDKARTLETGTNSEYLKNIFVTFMETDNFDELFPVLNTMLQFSPAEQRQMTAARKARASYLGGASSYLPSSKWMFSGKSPAKATRPK